jgi:hypothetical protein
MASDDRSNQQTGQADQAEQSIQDEADRTSVSKNDTKTPGGFRGFYEKMLRGYQSVIHAMSLFPIYLLSAFCLGLSLSPGLWVFNTIQNATMHSAFYIKYPALGFAFALAFYCYGFTLIFMVPFFNFILRASPKPSRGPYYSWNNVVWYIHVIRFSNSSHRHRLICSFIE